MTLNLKRPLHAIALPLACSLLVACGDGGGGGDDGSGTLPTINTYATGWLQGQCNVVGGVSSSRFLLTVTKIADNSVSYTQRGVQYMGTACAGTGTVSPTATNMGSVTFLATEGHGGVTFNRGSWTRPPGITSPVIWALKTRNRLCLFSDGTPTAFPTAKNVADYTATLLNEICYDRQ
ncbi:MAG: hypothetical protein Q8J78_03170 [Moraxellaceae bacterium]|nr:hypothetical protein [Moraxellaceae bacterium]